jgi:hypothetical protein
MPTLVPFKMGLSLRLLGLWTLLCSAHAFLAATLTVPGSGSPRCALCREGEWSSDETPVASTPLEKAPSRRSFLHSVAVVATAGASSVVVVDTTLSPPVAHAVGPIKIGLEPTSYKAVLCPPDRPIPGEKAMVGMRGLCVTVEADLESTSPKDLIKVGVYGRVVDGDSGDSVLANNPDGASDAGQFAMIESVTTKDKKVTFEFIAAVPKEKDIAQYANGIGPLEFSSLRIVSYPGGQQFGAISPCEYSGTSCGHIYLSHGDLAPYS